MENLNDVIWNNEDNINDPNLSIDGPDIKGPYVCVGIAAFCSGNGGSQAVTEFPCQTPVAAYSNICEGLY